MKEKKPSIREVDTAVGEILNMLDKPVYDIKREEMGENIYYTLLKNNEFFATYRIKPGNLGGPIQCSDDPDLTDEWVLYLREFIWPELERRFGAHPGYLHITGFPDVEEKEDLSELERGIVRVCEKVKKKKNKISDIGIANQLEVWGITNKKGKEYSREWINQVRNRLIDKGYDVCKL